MRHSGNELINPFKLLERVGIQPGWSVADFGCGALGHFVFPASQFVGGDGHVYAIDIDKVALKAIERAMKHEQIWNIHPVWSDIEVEGAARVPHESLDLALVVNNLFLSKNRAGLVKEVMRLVKPGGLIMVVEWMKDARRVLGPSVEQCLSEEEAKACFLDPDLILVDQFDAGDAHYALVFRRLERCSEPHVISVAHPQEA